MDQFQTIKQRIRQEDEEYIRFRNLLSKGRYVEAGKMLNNKGVNIRACREDLSILAKGLYLEISKVK